VLLRKSQVIENTPCVCRREVSARRVQQRGRRRETSFRSLLSDGHTFIKQLSPASYISSTSLILIATPTKVRDRPLSRISSTPAHPVPMLTAGTTNNKRQSKSQERLKDIQNHAAKRTHSAKEPNNFPARSHPRSTLKLEHVAKTFSNQCNHFADLLATRQAISRPRIDEL
jgi:hypothetical protein